MKAGMKVALAVIGVFVLAAAQDKCVEETTLDKRVFGGPRKQATASAAEPCKQACKAVSEFDCKTAVFYIEKKECLLYDFDATERPELVLPAKAGEATVLITITCPTTTTPTTTTTTTGSTTTTTTADKCANLNDPHRPKMVHTCAEYASRGCCDTDKKWMDQFCPKTCCKLKSGGGSQPTGGPYQQQQQHQQPYQQQQQQPQMQPAQIGQQSAMLTFERPAYQLVQSGDTFFLVPANYS